MELIVGLIGESGLSPEDIEHETEKLGWKVSRFTILNWLYGSVKRPQNYTMTIVALALGYTKTWGRTDGKSLSKPLSAVANERRSHAAHH